MLRDRVIESLRQRRAELDALGVRHAAVFGSVARADDHPDSDVDERKAPGLFAIGRIQIALEKMIGRPVDLARRSRSRGGTAEAAARDAIDAF